MRYDHANLITYAPIVNEDIDRIELRNFLETICIKMQDNRNKK